MIHNSVSFILPHPFLFLVSVPLLCHCKFYAFGVARGVRSTSAPFCFSRGRALIDVHLKTVIIWPYFLVHFFQCTVTYVRWAATIPCSLLFFFAFFILEKGRRFIHLFCQRNFWFKMRRLCCCCCRAFSLVHFICRGEMAEPQIFTASVWYW